MGSGDPCGEHQGGITAAIGFHVKVPALLRLRRIAHGQSVEVLWDGLPGSQLALAALDPPQRAVLSFEKPLVSRVNSSGPVGLKGWNWRRLLFCRPAALRGPCMCHHSARSIVSALCEYCSGRTDLARYALSPVPVCPPTPDRQSLDGFTAGVGCLGTVASIPKRCGEGRGEYY
jgi:hypothetical protein